MSRETKTETLPVVANHSPRSLSGSGSLVDASGYKFAEKDTKPGKIKVKKTSKASVKKKADGMNDLALL